MNANVIHAVVETIALNTVLSCEGSWEGSKSDRPAGSGHYAWRKGLARHLMRVQRGLCVQCGEMLDHDAEFNHVVRRGPKGKGWLAGNIFLGHPTCNEMHPHRNLDVADLERADLLALTWPDRKVLQSWSR